MSNRFTLKLNTAICTGTRWQSTSAGLKVTWKSALLLVLLQILFCGKQVALASDNDENLVVNLVYLARQEEPIEPLSLVDDPIENPGVPGAELGLFENQTTGRFIGHDYHMEVVKVEPEKDLTKVVKSLVSDRPRLFVADLLQSDLLSAADAVPDSLFINVRDHSDQLRNEACRSNILHALPSYAQLTDGLAQYLSWKRWNRLILVQGRHPQDAEYADSFRRAAHRFGLKLLDEKSWTSKPGARRTDSGHHSLQSEVPVFTQFEDHDVLVVADAADEFGEYLLFHTTRPRVVAGTQGLYATAWHRTHEQWGGTQLQRRFFKRNARDMRPRDYAAWVAVRSIGEAVTALGSVGPDKVRDYMFSSEFKLGAFKGVPLTWRKWNGQLRQPILITGARMLISVSPQQGFLHQYSDLDTMGFDRPESGCKVFDQ